MKEQLQDNAMDALYGAQPDAAPIKRAPTRHRPRSHSSHHRKAKPFDDGPAYRPYLPVGAVAVVVTVLIFDI